LRGQVDAIVALTHLILGQDVDLVAAVPEIDLVLGGHEHENWLLRRGLDSSRSSRPTPTSGLSPSVTMRFGRQGPAPRCRPGSR